MTAPRSAPWSTKPARRSPSRPLIEALASSHQRVRRLRRLVQKRSLRWSEGVCVLEGPDLVDEALATGQELEALYMAQGATGEPRFAASVERGLAVGVRSFVLAPGVMERVADASTPQPILATMRFRAGSVAELGFRGFSLILHDVRDPGNAGTVIRSADAAGADAVIFTGHSVDPYSPKTLRATAGSIFHLPVAVAELADAVGAARAAGATVWAAVVRDGRPYLDVELGGPVVVVIGNESEGLDADALALCDDALSIPMPGRSESLNLGVAASLILFEALRQREAVARQSGRPSLGEL
jgi:RNA methyltransferase, TrmH family